uniref:Adenine nucleotide translocase lysine methyltransferase n=1 Tax=Anas platyrhynchos TaxID=8839 RepID=A0A8B9ZLY1_ANAPL
MDTEALDELAGQLRGEALGGRGLLQLATATGLAAYAVWAAVLMPGFRRVPLHLQVPYMPSSAQQVANVMALLRGRSGKTADLGSGDGRLVLEAHKQGLRPAVGYELNPWLLWLAKYRAWKAGCHEQVSFLKQDLWKANLSDCYNVTVFLAPSVVSPSALRCCCPVLSRLRREILENRANLEYWQRFFFFFNNAKNKRLEVRKNQRVTQVGIKFAFSPGPSDARGQSHPCFLEGPSAAAAFWDPPAPLRSSPMSAGGTAPRNSRGTGSPGRAAPSSHISGPRLSVSPQKPPLAAKLLAELPDEARVVAGRFPFPSWTPSSTLGQGLEQAWAYDMKEVRRAARCGGTPGVTAPPGASPTSGLSPGEQ